ncbi:MAG: hypothetical protein ABI693_20035 [Bryobacteraceae bacterium]
MKPLLAAGLLICLATIVMTQSAEPQSKPGLTSIASKTEVMVRVPNDTPPLRLSAAQLEAIEERREAMEEAADARVDNHPPSPPGLPLVRDPETALAPFSALTSLGALTPDSYVLGKTVTNPNVALAGQTSIVEPSVSNQSLNVFYLSNDRADFSSDGGNTWTQLTIPGGPADAPVFCCDQTIVYDPSHSMWLWSRLYTTSASNNGVVHISVIKNAPTIACTFKYDPAGTADNMKPDYPQIGLSDNMFYQSTSEFQNGVWLRARMRRIPLDDLANCPASVTANVVDFQPASKRMWTPVRGAKEIMYWGQFENSTQLRIWSWPESSATATSVVQNVSATTFADSDCRGGTNNLDWIQSKGWGIGEGFLRGALARGGVGSANPTAQRLHFYWNGGADATHPQAYIRSAVFLLPSMALLAQPNINSNDFCYGYADVHPNSRGDLGLSLAFGGKTGGGGPALSGAVAIEDEFTPNYSLGTVFVTTTGTHMPSGQRYGDYLSVKPHEPCGLWWTAANYALSGGTGATNLVARYLQFGRARDQNCWERWNEVTPKVLP